MERGGVGFKIVTRVPCQLTVEESARAARGLIPGVDFTPLSELQKPGYATPSPDLGSQATDFGYQGCGGTRVGPGFEETQVLEHGVLAGNLELVDF